MVLPRVDAAVPGKGALRAASSSGLALSSTRLSFAKIVLQDWTMGQLHASHGPQCPSHSLCGAPCARRSEPAPTLHSRTWRSDSSSPCSAVDQSDRDSGASIVSSGYGSPTIGLGGERRFISFVPKP